MKLVIGALLAITGALFMLPGAASAHAVILSADRSCLAADGSWSIEWTARNSEDDQAMHITSDTVMKFNDVVVADPVFTPNPVPAGGSATATTSFGPDSTTWFVDLTVEADWLSENVHDGDVIRVFKPTKPCFVPNCENSEEYAAEHPEECNPDPCLEGGNNVASLARVQETDDDCYVQRCIDGELVQVHVSDRHNPEFADTGDCDVTTICVNGTLVTGTEADLANLQATDDCGEEPCAYNPDISATDRHCAPPPEYGEICVDTDGDGKGDEYQIFVAGNPPAGGITSADGDACTPVTLPEEPQVEEVQAVAEVLPVALPAAGNGGMANGTTAFAGLAGLGVVLLAGGGAVAMVARRR